MNEVRCFEWMVVVNQNRIVVGQSHSENFFLNQSYFPHGVATRYRDDEKICSPHLHNKVSTDRVLHNTTRLSYSLKLVGSTHERESATEDIFLSIF